MSLEGRQQPPERVVRLSPPHKVLLITTNGIQDEALVGIRNVCLPESALVGQIKLAHDWVVLKPWLLDGQLVVDGLIRLYPHLQDSRQVRPSMLAETGGMHVVWLVRQSVFASDRQLTGQPCAMSATEASYMIRPAQCSV